MGWIFDYYCEKIQSMGFFWQEKRAKGGIFMATFLVYFICMLATFCLCEGIILVSYRWLGELLLKALDYTLYDMLHSSINGYDEEIDKEDIDEVISDIRTLMGLAIGFVTGVIACSMVAIIMPFKNCAMCCAIIVVLISYFGVMRTIRMEVGYWNLSNDGSAAIMDITTREQLCDFRINANGYFFNANLLPKAGERCIMVKIRNYMEWLSLDAK